MIFNVLFATLLSTSVLGQQQYAVLSVKQDMSCAKQTILSYPFPSGQCVKMADYMDEICAGNSAVSICQQPRSTTSVRYQCDGQSIQSFSYDDANCEKQTASGNMTGGICQTGMTLACSDKPVKIIPTVSSPKASSSSPISMTSSLGMLLATMALAHWLTV